MNDKKLIYTIGDSHCWHTWCKIPFVLTNTCGPMTMHHFGLSKAIMVDKIPEDAIVVFCWGEIDCRCHVHKYQPWRETIETLVKEYLETIDLNAKYHKNIWIYNVVPPPRRSGVIESPSFPFLGSDEERLSYVKYMNELLKKSKYPFVDTYDKYSDKEGFLLLELSDYHVHIEYEKYLLEWLNNKLSLGGQQ